MTDIKATFLEYTKRYSEAIENGNLKLANKFHKKLTTLYQTIKNEGKWNILHELINNSDEDIKLWAATFLLKNDEKIALGILNDLKKSEKIIGLTASSIIDLWNKGLLKL